MGWDIQINPTAEAFGISHELAGLLDGFQKTSTSAMQRCRPAPHSSRRSRPTYRDTPTTRTS